MHFISEKKHMRVNHTMKTNITTLTTCLFLSAQAFAAATESRSEAKTAGGKPNIIVIFADDLGYGDVQCYNPQRGKIPTPNIDRLASQGMRFTDGHSSSGVCSPSRYTLLTDAITGVRGCRAASWARLKGR